MHDGKTKYAKSGKSGALEDAESQEAEDKARLEVRCGELAATRAVDLEEMRRLPGHVDHSGRAF